MLFSSRACDSLLLEREKEIVFLDFNENEEFFSQTFFLPARIFFLLFFPLFALSLFFPPFALFLFFPLFALSLARLSLRLTLHLFQFPATEMKFKMFEDRAKKRTLKIVSRPSERRKRVSQKVMFLESDFRDLLINDRGQRRKNGFFLHTLTWKLKGKARRKIIRTQYLFSGRQLGVLKLYRV